MIRPTASATATAWPPSCLRAAMLCTQRPAAAAQLMRRRQAAAAAHTWHRQAAAPARKRRRQAALLVGLSVATAASCMVAIAPATPPLLLLAAGTASTTAMALPAAAAAALQPGLRMRMRMLSRSGHRLAPTMVLVAARAAAAKGEFGDSATRAVLRIHLGMACSGQICLLVRIAAGWRQIDCGWPGASPSPC